MCCRDMTEDEIPKALECPVSEELWENLCRLQCRKMCVSLDQQLYFYLMQNDRSHASVLFFVGSVFQPVRLPSCQERWCQGDPYEGRKRRP